MRSAVGDSDYRLTMHWAGNTDISGKVLWEIWSRKGRMGACPKG